MNRILLIIAVVTMVTGCLSSNNNEEIPSFFKTDAFSIGDKITYELWGKMTTLSDEGAFYSYLDLGLATIEIKEDSVDDGAGNQVNVIDFHMKSDETPSNHTKEVKEELSINLEKHVYRLRGSGVVGDIIKSYSIHHAINREREFTTNVQPVGDILDEFLQKEYNGTMNGSFTYQNMTFSWEGDYDRSLKAYRIDLSTEANNISTVQIWIKNGYPLPYQITFKQEDGVTLNKYTYTLKKFTSGSGSSYFLGDVNYETVRDVTFYDWKGFGAPTQGSGGRIKLSIQTAMADVYKSSTPYYDEFRDFLDENPGSYMNFAEYWQFEDDAGWNLYFGNRTTTYSYMLNASNTNRFPIPSRELNYYYIPYTEIPKDIDSISNELISVSEAENIFNDYTEWGDVNDSFRISFIEQYYPDTLFEIWEGNAKEKDIKYDYPNARRAALVDGFHQPVRDYVFGYWLVIPHTPFPPSEFKINGADGIVTYTYEEY